MAYSVNLSVKPGNWRLFTTRKHDPKFKPLYTKIVERDGYTCQFCGFQAKDYQEVVNLDQNYRNNRVENLVTACCFCTQCFFLEAVGHGDYGGGTLIYMPEIPQNEINSFCHVLFCAMANGTGYRGSAQAIYRSLKFRSKSVDERYGDGASNPSMFGRMMIETGNYSDEIKGKLLSDLRLLPSRAKFRAQIERWAAAALEEMSSE